MVFSTGSASPEESAKEMQRLLELKKASVIGSLPPLTQQKDDMEKSVEELVEKIIGVLGES